MNKLKSIYTVLFLFIVLFTSAQKKSDTHLIGHVTGNGEHLPFATIVIEGTTIGTATDETGHFQIFNLEPDIYKVKAQAIGFKSQTKQVDLKLGNTAELKFDLVEDLIGLEQVVVSANRNEQNRKEALTVVSTISPKLFTNTQSVTIGEGLSFTPGLRIENNCQNCGFTQIRMNGMEGPYSQILINSRPIFSGLAGVYGLELFPANMIERIEVVRGGGSALFGSNAIAGTVNLITKDPLKSGFDINTTSSIIGVGVNGSGNPALDNNINFNASIVDLEAKAGVTVFGFIRDRQPFDANGDDFSEIALIKNTTVGTRAYHRTGKRGKITVDYFNIRENRRGGNKFDYVEHEADIAESVEHNINTGALSYDQLFKDGNKLSIFGSVQNVNRKSYYGANSDLSAYGRTTDLSYSVGTQLSVDKEKLLFAKGNIVTGIENTGGFLKDNKLGYYDIVNGNHVDNMIITKQNLNTTGLYAQAEWQWNRFKASLGARLDHYIVKDEMSNEPDVTGTVLSPRLSFKYDITSNVMARVSYSQGFRAPQIFDEDLHIEASGAQKVVHVNHPDLKQEESRSYMASLDIDKPLGYMQNQWLIEGFYTALMNPFVHERSPINSEGVIYKTRMNAPDGAHVYGVNIEWNLAPSSDFMIRSGYTYQKSEYKKPQLIFSDQVGIYEKEFMRTPNSYGFITLDYDFWNGACLSYSGTYTGEMLIPYAESEIKTTEQFFDMGIKLMYDIKLNGTTLQLNGGVKNMFNSYQSNFDSGINRDPTYVYGPGLPRTIYFGIRFSNII